MSKHGTYALFEAPTGTMLKRLDPATGVADRELAFGPVLDWAVADEGLLLAEQTLQGVLIRTLTPELVIRSTQAIGPATGIRTLARGALGWVFHRPGPPTGVDNTKGLPWGEIGDLALMEVNLGGFFAHDVPRLPLGQYAQWFVNEDNVRRRLLDQDSPTGVEPALAHGAAGCTVVLGQFSSKTAMFGNVHQGFSPRQVVCVVDPGGRIRRVDRYPPNWVQQVVLHESQWFVSTSAGLQIEAPPRPPRVIEPRPRTGALRWFPAGREMYAVGMDAILPARGWSVSHCDRDTGQLRRLAHDPASALLGHLTSRVRTERPRVAADGDGLWMAVAGGPGSQILHVTRGGVREVFAASGWAEPVARCPAGLLFLHRPDAAPGVDQPLAATLAVLPG